MTNFLLENKKVIIFDLDGTLVDLPVNWTALKYFLIQMYEEEYKEKCNFERISQCLDKIVEKNDENVLRRFFEIIRQYESEKIQDVHIIQEPIYFIKNKELFGLQEETKFAVLSLNTRNTIKKALKTAGVYDKIDYIIGREDVRRWKPAPEGLLKIQKYFGVKKEEMIYFGDLKSDILTGKNAGIEAYFIDDLTNFLKKKIK
jgi:phosphoglycolate phosphatase